MASAEVLASNYQSHEANTFWRNPSDKYVQIGILRFLLRGRVVCNLDAIDVVSRFQ